jgi:hypothetical protein
MCSAACDADDNPTTTSPANAHCRGTVAGCPSRRNSVGRRPGSLLSAWVRQLDSLHRPTNRFDCSARSRWITTWYHHCRYLCHAVGGRGLGRGIREDCRLSISGELQSVLESHPKTEDGGQEIELWTASMLMRLPPACVPTPPEIMLSYEQKFALQPHFTRLLLGIIHRKHFQQR